MSYLDIGFNEFLTREQSSPIISPQLDPIQFDNFAPQMSGEKIDTEMQGNLVGKGISASNITAGFMSFDRAQGGTLILGGAKNVNGVFSLKDENNIEKIAMNKDGMTISEGGLTLQDQSNKTVFDSTGLVSTTSFPFYDHFDSTARSTSSGSFTAITNTGINFVLPRTTQVLFLISMDTRTVSSLASGDRVTMQVGFSVDGTLYPPTGGFGSVYTLDNTAQAEALRVGSTFSAQYILGLSAGAHYTDLQWRKTLTFGAPPDVSTNWTSFIIMLLGK